MQGSCSTGVLTTADLVRQRSSTRAAARRCFSPRSRIMRVHQNIRVHEALIDHGARLATLDAPTGGRNPYAGVQRLDVVPCRTPSPREPELQQDPSPTP